MSRDDSKRAHPPDAPRPPGTSGTTGTSGISGTSGEPPSGAWRAMIGRAPEPPPEMKGSPLEPRARLLLRFAFGFGTFNMGFAPILLLSSATVAAVICFVTTSVMTGTPLVLRWTRSLTISSHVFIASTVGLFGGISCVLGGLNSPTTPIMAVAPILAVFLIGRTAGFVWSVVVIAFVAVFFGLAAAGVNMPEMIEPVMLPRLKAVGLATLVGVGLFFTLRYDDAKNDAIAVVKRANRRMRRMIAHLDATSDALSQSAAEFLGAAMPGPPQDGGDGGDTPGLTQQMLSTADSSRQMIGDMGASIRGMISQYTTISMRIHELHQQSGTIEALVKTIDNISNRLDLMALNTGIEAANAGVAGRRFQLLADDMRRLAERVVDETRRIKSSLRTVQEHTKAAMEASHAGQVLTDEGTLRLEEMASRFGEMHRLIDRTAEASQRITGDTIAQLTTIHDLVSESLSQREPGA